MPRVIPEKDITALQFVDEAENLAIVRAQELFGAASMFNHQSAVNMAAYRVLLEPGIK